MAMPLIGVSAGLALTEMPGLLFCCAAIICLLAPKPKVEAPLSTVYGVIAGLCLAAAIMARQNYLLLLIAAPTLLVNASAVEKLRVAVAITISLLLVIPIFLIWGGLVPPKTASVGVGFSLYHVVLSLAYLSIIAMVIDFRQFLQFNRRLDIVAVAGITICVAAAVFILGEFKPFTPLASWAKRILPEPLLHWYAAMFPVTLCFCGVMFARWAIRSIASLLHRYDAHRAFFWASVILLCLSNGKIVHQFSSRYVVGAIPLLLLASPPPATFRPAYLIRVISAIIISEVALMGYFR
jgi:hypothetical protein